MSRRELERVAVMGRVASGDLALSSAAEMLGLKRTTLSAKLKSLVAVGAAG